MRNIGENEITNMGGNFNYINCNCITDLSGSPETNLFEPNDWTYTRCKNNGNGTYTSDITDGYYCTMTNSSLKTLLLQNKGKTITFSFEPKLTNKRISVIITGTRTGGTTYQEISTDFSGEYNSASGVIADDFTSITSIELRWNRQATQFTDTTTTISNIRLEISD